MQLETAQVYIAEGAHKSAVESTLRARLESLAGREGHVSFARNLEDCWGAGDYTLDFLPGGDRSQGNTAIADLSRIAGIARFDHVTYESIGGRLRQPGLSDGIWRTLMFRVRAGADDARIANLERELLQMPLYMAGIRNWRLSRVTTPNTWTHVWQQEFASVDDLRGEYLMHPFHWAWVDRFFDAEHPEWIVDAISHAACPIASSLLAHSTP